MTQPDTMRLLLTTAGISNPSIHEAQVDLLGKPIAESSALCIPNAIDPSRGGQAGASRFIFPGFRTGLEIFGGAGTHCAAQRR